MFIIGALVNGLAIVVGTLTGKLAHRIPESVSVTVMQVMGLSVITLGLQMGFKSHQFLIVILSLAIGAVIGEFIDLDEKLNLLGNMIERKFQSQQNDKQTSSISQELCNRNVNFCYWSDGDCRGIRQRNTRRSSVLFKKR